MWLFELSLIAGVVVVAAITITYVVQTWLIFPGHLDDRREPTLPETAERIEAQTPDGTRLSGVHVPPVPAFLGNRTVLLGFGGNAWNADGLAEYLHELLPNFDIVAFHYRGYGPSGGRPSAATVLKDGLVVHDFVRQTLGDIDVIAVGLSLGTGVAAYLAARRQISGLILVTPFDSLKALAFEHYPLLAWLLLQRIETLEYLRDVTAPTAVIAAGHDAVVPPRRTAPVRRAVANLVYDRTIADADHNDIYGDTAFRTAMLEAIERIRSASTGGGTTSSAETGGRVGAPFRNAPDQGN
jgi:uncharacterized protein